MFSHGFATSKTTMRQDGSTGLRARGLVNIHRNRFAVYFYGKGFGAGC